MPLENPGRSPFGVDVARLLNEIGTELQSAQAHHGAMKSRHEAYAVIAEELDEFWNEVKRNPRKMTLDDESKWRINMRKELIQTAAMALRAILDLGLAANGPKEWGC